MIQNVPYTQDQIRKIKEACEEDIQKANKVLEQIRKVCTHENTHIGKYSWRIGSITDAEICSDCGKCIEIIGISNNKIS